MSRKLIAITAVILLIGIVPEVAQAAGGGDLAPRQRILLDPAWKFHLGEIPDSAASPDFNAAEWRNVDLPHDFVVEGTFDPKADLSHGFLPADVGWYRKSFNLPAEDRGKRLFLDFEGVYRDSTVWLNGHQLGNHQSGYTGFQYDISEAANYGGSNVLAVRVDARKFEGWWYEGGGIYRHVWLVKTDPVHVDQWGTYVTSRFNPADESGSIDAEITVETTVANSGTSDASCQLISRIVGSDGRMVATATSKTTIPSGQNSTVVQQVTVHSARLWSLESPALYRLLTTVRRENRDVDRYVTPFGIRSLVFKPGEGFFLNGKPVKIKGTCNHQDFAGVGVALPDRIQAYKIEKLKEMGSNAYRCSHHPPAPELLDTCDRLGMLVMDENRKLGDSPEILSQVADMVRRDRNHPGIIMWSMCNEERMQGSEAGAKMFTAMKEVVKKYDLTRPVTSAMNGWWGYGDSLVEDLQGCNYNPRGYDGYHQKFPDQPVYGSETASTVCTRGVYANDRAKGYVSAYDLNAPPWAQTAEVAWKALADRPFMAGGFVWTGFDYRGEPTPYGWPCINSHFGIMDTCGFPKDNYYYYKSWWGDKPVVHLLPHWNWSGKEGQTISVWCFSNCDRVELFLNGASLGSQVMPPNGHLEWSVKYTPGRLEAKGYKGDRAIAADLIETTGEPSRLQLKPDRTKLTADGEDVSIVAVAVKDEKGRSVPTAANEVQFSVTGDAHILGVGNGDPSSHEPDKATKRHAFNGYCLVIVQAGTNPGPIRLTAESAGLKPVTITLRAN